MGYCPLSSIDKMPPYGIHAAFPMTNTPMPDTVKERNTVNT